TLKRMPFPETLVMVVTVAATVFTGNLAIGVAGGVIFAMMLFARRIAHVVHAERQLLTDGQSVRYTVTGPLFFASSNDLFEHFHYADDPQNVIIDLCGAQIWDASTVAVLDAIETRYQRYDAKVNIVGLDIRSADFHQRLSGKL
ncbi:STAS domain-containing protein, partial [Enterobacter sp. R1(2018)]|uniref:STAS domain-containing protein n=1 Tax=Enterobacter sp. R1(2018) TaxID=2447891 RepID=UPI00217EF38F